MSETPTPKTAFDGWSLRSLRTHIEDLARVIPGLDDEYADAREELEAEYDAAVASFKARMRADTDQRTAADGGDSVDDLVDEQTDDDHFLRHVTDEESTFSGRHERDLSTAVEGGVIVHRVAEEYADDAHGESIAWKRGAPRGTCDHCDADLITDDHGDDGHYVETADCPNCPFAFERVSADAPIDDSDYMRPIRATLTVPHDWENEADVDWDDMRENLREHSGVDDLANVVRALSLRQNIALIRDAAYDSDEGILTVECGHCETTVETPAVETHAHYGDVCPECADVEVWTPNDADLPDDVEARMDDHKTFNADRIVRLLRDVIHYGDYRRTNADDEDADAISDGIVTGRGGKRDAHGMGRGTPGTGLRRPSGAFHNFAHWRTVLGDAAETDLIERVDDRDVDDDHKDARWTATDKGQAVFDELARCRTCGGRKHAYKFVRSYQTHGRYTNKDSRLTLACADCDEMSYQPTGMVISSSSGSYAHQELDGVEYAE